MQTRSEPELSQDFGEGGWEMPYNEFEHLLSQFYTETDVSEYARAHRVRNFIIGFYMPKDRFHY